MGDETAPDLTALLGSRICHDLISPIGAIGNGLELISMTGNAKTPEMALVTESVEKAQARIRFYRIAFGAGRSAQAIGLSELTAIVNDLHRGGRLKVSWDSPGALARPAAKLLALLVMCLESALARGGQITVRGEGRNWVLAGEGPRLRDLPEVWPVLEHGPQQPALSPDLVQFALARQQAQDMGLALRVQTGAAGVTIHTAPG